MCFVFTNVHACFTQSTKITNSKESDKTDFITETVMSRTCLVASVRSNASSHKKRRNEFRSTAQWKQVGWFLWGLSDPAPSGGRGRAIGGFGRPGQGFCCSCSGGMCDPWLNLIPLYKPTVITHQTLNTSLPGRNVIVCVCMRARACVCVCVCVCVARVGWDNQGLLGGA